MKRDLLKILLLSMGAALASEAPLRRSYASVVSGSLNNAELVPVQTPVSVPLSHNQQTTEQITGSAQGGSRKKPKGLRKGYVIVDPGSDIDVAPAQPVQRSFWRALLPFTSK